MISREQPTEVAGVVIPWTLYSERPSEDRQIETQGLVEALDCKLSFIRSEQIRNPTASHLFSAGLLENLAVDLKAAKATIAIVDASLTPVQQRNLENSLGVKVIDRTGLILEIFGLRARTSEGRLQVELARQLYERSRLVRTWTHLERQRGGNGFLSGPGESQIESDRRMLNDKISRLRRSLDDVRRTRKVQRAGRQKNETPIVALVGYTNAGKSTLFNRLSEANVFVKDMPFATLDTTIRHLKLPTVGEVALIDTVGFISDLPTALIESFKATLEEAMFADILLHVRDRSSNADIEQSESVYAVLNQLETAVGRSLPPVMEVWNKSDLLDIDVREAHKQSLALAEMPTALVSATTGDGVEQLIKLIEDLVLKDSAVRTVTFGPENGKVRAWMHANGEVLEEEVLSNGETNIKVRLPQSRLGKFETLFPELAAKEPSIPK